MSLRTLFRTMLSMNAVLMALCLLMAGLDIATLPPLPFSLTEHILLSWLPWFLGAPLIAFIGVRYRPRSCHWGKVAAVHMAGFAVMVGLNMAVSTWFGPMVLDDPPDGLFSGTPANPGEGRAIDDGQVPGRLPYGAELRGREHADPGPSSGIVEVLDEPFPFSLFFLSLLPIYAVFTVVIQALLAFGEIKDRKAAEAQLRAELTQSRLAALRMQVNPHFLFNTLNSVNALMAIDVKRARAMLTDLSALLRVSFRDSEKQESPLSTEIELAEKYVTIQRVRFGERLSLRIDAPREVEAACVPTLLLQPLIENCIVHAVEKTTQACEIVVTARREGNLIRIDVSDNGPGDSGEVVSGIGLANTRARLTQMYGSRGTMEIETSRGSGFRVCLTQPFHETPGAEVSRE